MFIDTSTSVQTGGKRTMHSLKFIMLFAVAVAFDAAVATGRAQNIRPNKAPDETTILAIPQETRDEFYEGQRAARRKHAPRILLVPGILGSRIDECQPDNSQCRTIWGTVAAIVSRNIDLSVKLDRRYRTDVVDRFLFKDVYGVVLDSIRDSANKMVPPSTDDPLLTVFHYDWRQSNADTAILLKERICELRARAPSSPFYILAHSMGGLLTKIWAKRYSQEPCSHGRKPEIAQIVFVATPHLGSPKTIKAIAVGYSLLFDDVKGLRGYLNKYETNYLLQAINEAGVSFESLYELLPIRTSEYCRNQKPELARATNPASGDDGKPINLFDVATWKRYDLLRRIGGSPAREVYYDSKVEPLLRKSELLLCEIVDFDPSKVAPVVYVFGREKTDTTQGWFRLKSGSSYTIESSIIVHGDGTVPVYSGQNLLVSTTFQTREVETDHTSIISSPAVQEMIDDWFLKARKAADVEVARVKREYASLLTIETAASGNLLPVSLDPRAWSNEDERFATEINSQALTLMGYKPSKVAQFASTTPNPIERARLYAIAASNAVRPRERLSWTNNAAQSAYQASRFEDAIKSAEFVIATSDKELPAAAAAVLQKKAKEVVGWAYLRAGDTEKFNSTATTYANQFEVNKEEFKEPATIARTATINPNLYPPYREGAGGVRPPWEWHAAPGPGKRGAMCVTHVDINRGYGYQVPCPVPKKAAARPKRAQ
jgi:hypothetical protein